MLYDKTEKRLLAGFYILQLIYSLFPIPFLNLFSKTQPVKNIFNRQLPILQNT